MCRIMEELKDKVALERNRDIALRLISRGKMSFEEIAEATGLTLDEVKELAEKHTA